MSLSNTLTPLLNQAKNQSPPFPKALQLTLPALPVGCTSRMHLNATLPSYPHCFSPAPTTFPAEAPEVVSKVWFLLAQLSGFFLPYKQSTPSLGPAGTHVYPFLGRKPLFREKGQGLVLGSGTFTQENPSGRGTSCVISHTQCHWCPRKSRPGPSSRTAPWFPQSWVVNLWGNDSATDQGPGHLWQDAICLQLPTTRSQDRAECNAGEVGGILNPDS